MKNRPVEMISIDLSNRCSKQCPFCYNHSNRAGLTQWTPDEVIEFVRDCVANGVRAVSLGGGEPFEYPGVFEVIDALEPIVYLSVTSNGLPLLDSGVWEKLLSHRPDKVHITLHNPDRQEEIEMVCGLIRRLTETDITPGVNLLVDSSKIDSCRSAYRRLRQQLSPKQIILVPRRFGFTPSPDDLACITGGEPFQAPSCLLKCTPPANFCSVSFDKTVNRCSYACGRQPMQGLTFDALTDALGRVDFRPCSSET